MNATTLDRIAMLIDEMLRKGVPKEVLQQLIDWVRSHRRGPK